MDNEELLENNDKIFEKNINGFVLKIFRLDDKNFELRLLKDNEKVIPNIEFHSKLWKKMSNQWKNIIKNISEHTESNLNFNKLSLEIDNSYDQYTLNKINSLREISERSSCSDVNVDLGQIFKNSKVNVTIFDSPILGLNNVTMFTTFTLIQEGENGFPTEKNYILFEDGKVLPLNVEILKQEGLFFKSFPPAGDNRWSIEFIEKYCIDQFQDEYDELLYNLDVKLNSLLHDYLDYPGEGEGAYSTITYWIIGTYFQHVFNSYPYILFNGLKDTGKSKSMDFTNQLAFNSIKSANMSTSSLFRQIESRKSTVLIDEAERINDGSRMGDFRDIILSGYKKGTKTTRTEEVMVDGVKAYVNKTFSLFSPKMIGNINGVEDVLQSRCITITMRATKNQTIGNLEIKEEDEHWQEYRNLLYLFMFKKWKNIKEVYDTIENEDHFFKNREWELWKPILSIAKFFGEDKYKDLLKYAKLKVKEVREISVTDTNDHQLIKSLLVLIYDDMWSDNYISIKNIRENLLKYMDLDENSAPWASPKWIGNSLRRMGFKISRHVGSGVEFMISKKYIIDQAERMKLDINEKQIREEIDRMSGG